jgi:hypothetical protein
MSVMRALTASATLLSAVALVACGAADGSEAESELERSARDELHAQEVDMDCPDDVELEGGAAFECRATVDGRRGVVLVSRAEDDGPVRWRLKPARAGSEAP